MRLLFSAFLSCRDEMILDCAMTSSATRRQKLYYMLANNKSLFLYFCVTFMGSLYVR